MCAGGTWLPAEMKCEWFGNPCRATHLMGLLVPYTKGPQIALWFSFYPYDGSWSQPASRNKRK